MAWSYPLVVLDRIVPGGVIPCVSADYRGGIGRAVAHLVARGCHQLAFIGGNTPPTTFSNSSASERLEGFREALRAHLIEPGDAPIVISDWTFEGGRKSLRTLLERPEPPDGVVVANDRMAAGVLKEARIQGLNVPGELAVVGFDDFEFARYLEPSLTTVHLPARAMAARATEILLNLIGGVPEAAEISTVLPIELVVRESA